MTIYTQLVTFSLIAVHWITLYIEILLNITKKTVYGIVDAHKPSMWVFPERNSVPWTKKTSGEVKNYSYPMTYNPETNTFIMNSRGGDGVKGGFGDVVMAELVNSDRILSFDMSSFFHELSWESVSKTSAPSLYEVVLVYCLTRDLVFTKESMKGFWLEVLTAEGKEIRVSISSEAGMANFSSWDAFGQSEEVAVA